jgi:two-component system response regulator
MMTEVTILIVEDSPDDVELMMRALKQNNLANQVQICEDGQEALDYLFCEGAHAQRSECKSPKVVFLDLKLPKVDGLEVLRRIKSNESTKTVPIVIVTSSQEEPDLQECYRLGANSYVVKPVDFDSFLKVISDLGFYWLVVNKQPVRGL